MAFSAPAPIAPVVPGDLDLFPTERSEHYEPKHALVQAVIELTRIHVNLELVQRNAELLGDLSGQHRPAVLVRDFLSMTHACFYAPSRIRRIEAVNAPSLSARPIIKGNESMSENLPPVPPPGAPLYGPKTDGNSIAALVTGLFGMAFVPIVLGILGLDRTKKNGTRGREFAIAGVVLGVVNFVVRTFLVVGLLFIVATHDDHIIDDANRTPDSWEDPRFHDDDYSAPEFDSRLPQLESGRGSCNDRTIVIPEPGERITEWPDKNSCQEPRLKVRP